MMSFQGHENGLVLDMAACCPVLEGRCWFLTEIWEWDWVNGKRGRIGSSGGLEYVVGGLCMYAFEDSEDSLGWRRKSRRDERHQPCQASAGRVLAFLLAPHVSFFGVLEAPCRLVILDASTIEVRTFRRQKRNRFFFKVLTRRVGCVCRLR
ncbi:hypothetical protein BJ508DRAFT_180980 [Ascobolus immersus RN42]|uniref:Uncharacterized protein n=1 Tax=Ascobolus immersus RN42 TaxID=1160509 RepID=A0A3N4HXX9_ASCIM|nr:hypothetical protein BJ508DRAFT_180980 [Ascobolus immersus RN42]